MEIQNLMLSFCRRILILFTLLALFGQSVFANGGAIMIEMSSTPNNETPIAQTIDVKNTANHACCDETVSMKQMTHHSPSCCDGNNGCKVDCNHCLTISMAGTLLSAVSLPLMNIPEQAMATSMPHFHSVSIGETIRPPIV